MSRSLSTTRVPRTGRPRQMVGTKYAIRNCYASRFGKQKFPGLQVAECNNSISLIITACPFDTTRSPRKCSWTIPPRLLVGLANTDKNQNAIKSQICRNSEQQASIQGGVSGRRLSSTCVGVLNRRRLGDCAIIMFSQETTVLSKWHSEESNDEYSAMGSAGPCRALVGSIRCYEGLHV